MGQYYPFFKAYDVRAKVPDELDAALAKRIGRAFVAELGAKTVVVGRDMRLSGHQLHAQLLLGLRGRRLTSCSTILLIFGICYREKRQLMCRSERH